MHADVDAGLLVYNDILLSWTMWNLCGLQQNYKLGFWWIWMPLAAG